MEKADRPVYPRQLPGLNGLRFLAAFAVLFGHLEQGLELVGIERVTLPSGRLPYLNYMGADAVSFFFVLSGFLITFLLLREQRDTGTIHSKNFYIRRMLRIWPLYYLVVFLSFFVLPNIAFLDFPGSAPVYDELFTTRLLLYLFMLPVVSTALFLDIPFAGVLWSIGVEEIFYLAWPPLLKWCRRHVIWLMLGILVLIFFARQIPGAPAWFSSFLYFFRINCMAVGGIGAWICFNRPSWLKLFFRIEVQIISWLLVAGNFLYERPLGPYHDFFLSVPFLVLILNVGLNPKTLLKLTGRALNYLGNISYGIYVYHWISITLCVNLLLAFGPFTHTWLNHLVILVSVFAMTVAIAAVSFAFFEKRFLDRKHRYSYAPIPVPEPPSPGEKKG